MKDGDENGMKIMRRETPEFEELSQLFPTKADVEDAIAADEASLASLPAASAEELAEYEARKANVEVCFPLPYHYLSRLLAIPCSVTQARLPLSYHHLPRLLSVSFLLPMLAAQHTSWLLSQAQPHSNLKLLYFSPACYIGPDRYINSLLVTSFSTLPKKIFKK